MGVDSTDAYGKPTFNDAFALPGDLTATVTYADTFANIRRGTSAERQALPEGKQRPGMLWVETDNNNTILTTDGAGNWTAAGSTPWMSIVLSTGWAAVGGHTPRARLIGGVVYIEGAAERGAGGSLDNIGKMPTPLVHLQSGSKTIFVTGITASKSGTALSAELYISQDGTLRVDGYTAIDGTTGWRLPLSSSYVRDQR